MRRNEVGVGSAKNVLDLKFLASSCGQFGANHVQILKSFTSLPRPGTDCAPTSSQTCVLRHLLSLRGPARRIPVHHVGGSELPVSLPYRGPPSLVQVGICAIVRVSVTLGESPVLDPKISYQTLVWQQHQQADPLGCSAKGDRLVLLTLSDMLFLEGCQSEK